MIRRTVRHIRHNRQLLDSISQKLDETLKINSDANQKLDETLKLNREILFANYFRDSIQNSTWVKDKSFSAYGGAANYSLLYKLYKIYDVVRPENILEFGLGQSTKLTLQYLKHNKKAKAFVIDDSQEWIDIYKNQFDIPNNLELIKLKLQDFKYKGKILQKNNEYAGLKKATGKVKFGLVIVDGPIGYDKEYSRTNIVSLTDNLAKNFIVIFDDAERPGEQRTIQILKEELHKNKIEFAEFDVTANKTQRYIVSHKLFNATFHV